MCRSPEYKRHHQPLLSSHHNIPDDINTLFLSVDTLCHLIGSILLSRSTTKMHFTTVLSALAVASGVFAAPTPSQLEARAVVAHDSLNPIRTRLQAGAIGRAIERFQPLLHIAHGCQPYTAVDDSGNTRYVHD